MSYEKTKLLHVTRRLQGVFWPATSVLLCSILLSASLFSSGLAQAACANTPDASQGTDTQTVTIPSTGTYFVWSRLLAPDTTNNSYYLQVDGGCAIDVGNSSSIPANAWTWVNYQDGNANSVTSVSLTAGTHQVVMTGRDPGVGVDRVLFLGDQACVPSGTGDNCTPAIDNPPTVSITAPASGATVSGSSVSLNANASDDHAVSSVAFSIDGTNVGTDTSSSYHVSWNSTTASDGSHTLVATATDSAGHKTTAQETITVANHTCAGAPTAPSLSGSSSSPTQTSLSWTASQPQSGCSIKDYNVYRGNTLLGTVSATSFNDGGLTPNTIYAYHVIANDNGGHSTSSPDASVTTLADTTNPSAPGNVTASAPTSAAVQLHWTVSTDNIGVAGYRVYKDGSLYKTVDGAASNSYTDNNVAANTDYTYKVSAIDTSDNESAQVTAAPNPIHTPAAVDTQKPTAPANLHTTLITANAVTLAWTASTDNVGVVGYHVYRGSTLVSTTAATGYTDTGLNASTAYAYHVAAYDSSANVSDSSSTVNATTLQGTTTGSGDDLNGDGHVNIFDLSLMAKNWGDRSATHAQGDINGDGVVNIFDLSALAKGWGS